jgi:long-chain acyl-CoA synthetase
VTDITKAGRLLKNIPEIDEAMVIGDGKPYCSAFLWVEETKLNLNNINSSIKKINEKLSRPEEVKAWVILENDLSIGSDLTANLKLKRKAIIKRYNEVIKFIYNSESRPDNILHFGRVEV